MTDKSGLMKKCSFATGVMIAESCQAGLQIGNECGTCDSPTYSMETLGYTGFNYLTCASGSCGSMCNYCSDSCIDCKAGSGGQFINGLECVPECGPGKFAETLPIPLFPKKKCTVCGEGCSLCTHKFQCDVCQDDKTNNNDGTCSNRPTVDFLPLKFTIVQTTSSARSSSAFFEVKFFKNDWSALPITYSLASLPDLKILTIVPFDRVIRYEPKLKSNHTMILEIDLKDDNGGEILIFEFSGNPQTFNPSFSLDDYKQEVEFQTEPKFSDSEKLRAQNLGSFVSGANTYAGISSDFIQIVLSMVGYDPAGILFKFSQMTKILTRFRLLNINFGNLLDKYFHFSSRLSDPNTKKTPSELLAHSKQSYGKLTSRSLALSVFDRFLLNTVLYLVTWLAKIVADILLKISTRERKIKVWHCNFVNYSQKAHLMLFNITALDVLVFCTRTIFHSRELGLIENGLAIVTLTFVAYDFTEIWILGSKYLHPKAYTEELVKRKTEPISVIDKIKQPENLEEQNSQKQGIQARDPDNSKLSLVPQRDSERIGNRIEDQYLQKEGLQKKVEPINSSPVKVIFQKVIFNSVEKSR